jgi:murein DD-endopeptidase MepM/ murein hydrolase activator NlpD
MTYAYQTPRAHRSAGSALRVFLTGAALAAALTTTAALAAGGDQDAGPAGDGGRLAASARDADWRTLPAPRGAEPARTSPAARGGRAAAFVRPTAGPITTPFHEEGQLWRLGFHPGMDIGAPEGAAIAASGEGVVVEAELDTLKGYGNYVKIDHGDGLITLYAHMSRIQASVGDRVGPGTVIGFVGMTGFTTGPHLHWEVRLNGELQDPASYLR